MEGGSIYYRRLEKTVKLVFGDRFGELLQLVCPDKVWVLLCIFRCIQLCGCLEFHSGYWFLSFGVGVERSFRLLALIRLLQKFSLLNFGL